MTSPWWFCNGWWSPWCVVDYIAHHWFGLGYGLDHWICRRHDASIKDDR
jgi:hypothetical protein